MKRISQAEEIKAKMERYEEAWCWEVVGEVRQGWGMVEDQ